MKSKVTRREKICHCVYFGKNTIGERASLTVNKHCSSSGKIISFEHKAKLPLQRFLAQFSDVIVPSFF